MLTENEGSPVFGIDLGTTYSCIARVDEYGRPEVIPNAEGARTTPSVVQFDGEHRIVGEEAKNSSILYPDATVSMIKRQMGKGKSGFYFSYEGREYTPEEISSYILRKVVQDAEQYLETQITDVVITCPAYFGIPERTATRQAGEIAGLNVRAIINEPTAAAIAYGMNQGDDQVVLVYDLGGGTFDITMIKIESGAITVICTDGDHFLGGRNWDELIVGYLAEQWQQETGSDSDPLDSPETLQELFLRAERAKIALTQRDTTDVAVMHEGRRVRVTLTREQFDSLTRPLLDRTIEKTRAALEQGKQRGVSHFDHLLLVGGSTRMPQVADRLREEFNIEPRIFEPDEAVAKGAAIYGYKLHLDEEIKTRIADQMGIEPEGVDIFEVEDIVVEQAQTEVAREAGLRLGAVQNVSKTTITNVTSRSFGVIVWFPEENREIVANIIRRNDPLPASVTQTFGTKDDNQSSVDIRIVDNLEYGDRFEVDQSRQIGEAELSLPPGLPSGSPIEVTFELNEQGLLHVHARDKIGDNEANVELTVETGTTQREIAEAKARSKSISIS